MSKSACFSARVSAAGFGCFCACAWARAGGALGGAEEEEKVVMVLLDEGGNRAEMSAGEPRPSEPGRRGE